MKKVIVRERLLKIFTWHIHGSYLFYLSQGNYQLYIPVSNTKKDRNIGRGETFPFGNNVIEVDVAEVKNLEFDCILFQHRDNYLTDQFNILSEEQRKLPRIYLEHDTPCDHPTNMQIVVDDKSVLIVHVTQFNRMMWDNKDNKAVVIEHGVIAPPVSYKGNIGKGIVVINDLPSRGRMLGFDVFKKMREQVPLELVGMNTGEFGRGEILHPQLAEFISNYRFFFNPIRYTSMGLAVIEAMMIGMPVVGLATTEMPAVFNGENGIVSNDPDHLVETMKLLLENKTVAENIGKKGQITAINKFNISRFINDWNSVFETVIKNKTYEKTNSLHQ